MLRDIGAVLAGMVVGGVANMAVILVSWAIWPMPEGMDMNDPEALQAYIATLPVAALLMAVLAHLLQAFLGGWVAARISADRPRVVAMIIGVLSMLGGILNMINLQGPGWMWGEVPLYLVVAWLAGTLEIRRRGA